MKHEQHYPYLECGAMRAKWTGLPVWYILASDPLPKAAVLEAIALNAAVSADATLIEGKQDNMAALDAMVKHEIITADQRDHIRQGLDHFSA